MPSDPNPSVGMLGAAVSASTYSILKDVISRPVRALPAPVVSFIGAIRRALACPADQALDVEVARALQAYLADDLWDDAQVRAAVQDLLDASIHGHGHGQDIPR